MVQTADCFGAVTGEAIHNVIRQVHRKDFDRSSVSLHGDKVSLKTFGFDIAYTFLLNPSGNGFQR